MKKMVKEERGGRRGWEIEHAREIFLLVTPEEGNPEPLAEVLPLFGGWLITPTICSVRQNMSPRLRQHTSITKYTFAITNVSLPSD